jgi:hypothetical protein
MRAQVLPLCCPLLSTSLYSRLAGVSGIWSGDDRRLGELLIIRLTLSQLARVGAFDKEPSLTVSRFSVAKLLV